MLDHLDRVQIATTDLDTAAEVFEGCLDAVRGPKDEVATLSAKRLTLGLPETEIELLAPSNAGPVEDFVEKYGAGLFGVGFSASDIDDLAARFKQHGQRVRREGDQLFAGPTDPGGLRVVLSPTGSRRTPPVSDALVRHIYEVTNPVRDLPGTSGFYTRLFGLDASKFQPIRSDLYAYDGTLTMFDPPELLDRIEVTQTFDDDKAMGRFFSRRGEELYMCFGETDRFDKLVERLDRLGARYQMRDPNDYKGNPDVLFIHPKSLSGVLMGVSATGVAWEWSSGPKK